MELFETLRCYGYHGFGSGFEMASTGPPGPGPRPDDESPLDAGSLYCGRACPMGQACWEVHRRRVATIVPDLAARFNEMAKTMQGEQIVRAWMDEMDGMAPPDVIIMTGNVEDGASVALGASPKDRGQFGTLTWPLTPLPQNVLDG